MEVFVLLVRGEFIGVYKEFKHAENYVSVDGYIKESQTDSGSVTTYVKEHKFRDDWIAEIIRTEVVE